MLPAPQDLDRTRLNFFIAGPGRGEGLALALPSRGWVFVDGCRTRPKEFPLQRIWERYRLKDEPVEGIVLTHPHRDHYAGMVELISATSPRWIACVATHHRDEGALRAEALTCRDDPLVDDHDNLLRRGVKDLLRRIQNAWNTGACARVLLRAGEKLPLTESHVTIEVTAPDREGARAFFAAQDPEALRERLKNQANELSAVLHVRFGRTRLVLGGDLPETDLDAGSRTGWTKVLTTYTDLPGSIVLKVPHHGSEGAMHPKMVGSGVAPEGAVWTLTPFRGGDDPQPRFDARAGVGALLQAVPQVYLTSLPAGWASGAPHDHAVPLDAVRRESVLEAIPGARSLSKVAAPESGPFEPVWLFAVDDAGRCTDAYRGERALKITRAGTPARPPAERGWVVKRKKP